MAEEIITSTNADTVTDHEYNASEIQVLKGLEAVRKRPGMYIGSTGERGLHHLVYEIVDNAIDEALAGYCDHIEVKILKGDIIQVTDNGRGIPVDIQADTGLPAVTVVYTILHAGGKFGGENSGYKVAGGLHGVGASVVNACSEWLTVNVRRDGREYEQTFRRGDPDGPLKCIGTVDPSVTGTRVTFKPDPEMFKDTTVYNFETLEKRLREESFLNAGVKITLTDERELYTPVLEDGKEGEPTYRTEVMCYEGGIKSFVTYLGEKRDLEVLHPNVIYLKGQTDRGMAEIALQYNSSYNELLLSFANNVNTPDGGTHEEGFRTSLTRVFNDYGRSHGLLKDKDENLSGSDVREGLICVISVMGELHLPRLRGAVGFIADTSWREYGIEVFHDFPGQLVGQNALDIGCGKQFGGCALPCSDTIDVVSHFPKVTRHRLSDNLFGAFFLVQHPNAIFFVQAQCFVVHIAPGHQNAGGLAHAFALHDPAGIRRTHQTI